MGEVRSLRDLYGSTPPSVSRGVVLGGSEQGLRYIDPMPRHTRAPGLGRRALDLVTGLGVPKVEPSAIKGSSKR